jgi:Putative peptidoglycan binding domain
VSWIGSPNCRALGLGNYIGEVRQGPDGQLYEWVQTVDGLGNPIGFWKKIRKVARGVARPVVKAAAPVVKVATDVAKGALRLLSKPQCIPLQPVRAPIRLIARRLCPIVQQPVVRRIAPIVPYVGPMIQATDRLCNLVRECGVAGLDIDLQGATAPVFLLKKGHRGQAIAVVQRLLNVWLTRSQATLPRLKEDGIFGSKTEQIVRSFQSTRGLKIDGLVGNQTWKRLLDELIVLAQTQDAGAQLGQFWTLSGIPLPTCFTPEPPDPRDAPIQTQFDAVVASNMGAAIKMTIPVCYETKLIEYAVHNPSHGLILVGGYLRCPLYFRGGWILKLVSTALAMTLNTRVFVDPHSPLDIGTYIHEIVHVWQYKILGITGFLASFFGISALVILTRVLLRRPLHITKSNPHEVQAYNIESRFMTWYSTHPCP